MIVVGIDAGFAATGLVAIDLAENRVTASACVRTQKTAAKRGLRVADDDAQRCAVLAERIEAFLIAYKPQAVIVELPHGGAQGARANRAMGMATGMIAAVLVLSDHPVEWVTPAAGKRAATGSNRGSKADVEAAVRARFDWGTHLPKTAVEREHVCDAAAAVMAAEHGALIQAVRRMEAG